MQDIAGYKDVIEELNEICEVLMEKCACSWVRDQTNETNEKYSSLTTRVQSKKLLDIFIIVFSLNNDSFGLI